MLSTALSLRSLLLVMGSASLLADKAPFLISETVWPQGCVLNCTRGRHRAVCGSNGQLYQSLCAFQRARCLDNHLKSVPLTHCSTTREPERAKDPVMSKCHLDRSLALERASLNDSSSVFIPECSEEGTFLPVQCHSPTGYCWCSTADGKPVGGTSLMDQRPNCTSQVSKTFFISRTEHLHKEEITARPTVHSSLSSAPSSPAADITPPPFLVTILLNSNPRRNRKVKRPSDTVWTCERVRAEILGEGQPGAGRLEERFIPECTANGHYSPVQCHSATGYCWCVRPDTGRALSGTSTRYQLPDCSPARTLTKPDRSYSERPLPGCPGAHKKEFLQRLLRILQLEALQIDVPSSPRLAAVSLSHAAFPLDSVPSPAAPDGDTAAHTEARAGLRSYFRELDVDSDGTLSEREARPLRLHLRRSLQPRRCAKKFVQYCDEDGDRRLTLPELSHCLAL